MKTLFFTSTDTEIAENYDQTRRIFTLLGKRFGWKIDARIPPSRPSPDINESIHLEKKKKNRQHQHHYTLLYQIQRYMPDSL